MRALIRLLGLLATVAALLVASATVAHAVDEPIDEDEKVRLCHRTGSDANPYVLVEVPPNEVAGHVDHPEDIIPPSTGSAARTIRPRSSMRTAT